MNIQDRVRLTSSCSDCAEIPKVHNAGEVVEENGELVQIMHNGVRVVSGGYHGQWMSDIIKNLSGHHEPQEEKVFYEILRNVHPGSVMIELGSYWAYYSCWFGKEIKESENYLIEPNVNKIKVGQKNFELNALTGRFTNGFIGESSKENAEFIDWDGRKTQIRRVCIDDFIKENRIEKVAILHSDIQGAEREMLKGALESIKSYKIDYMILSTHGDELHFECMKFLLKNKYRIISEHSPSESASADGLIACHSPLVKKMPRIHVSKLSNNINFRQRFKNSLRRIFAYL